MSVNKQAESGIPDVSAHRELAPHEEDALAAGKSRWMPRIFQSYGTPIPELMASPLKTGLIFGVPAGIIGAGLGSAMGGKNHGGMGALIGGLGAGGLAAIAAGMDREAKNEGLEELMRRMPEGAAKRDLLADPQYQSDFLGWDNSKIVATARARYYRPTERFSKRTFDMADARARYNERHKSSSVNKDDSMNEKQSMFGVGVPAGALLGLATSQKGKRLRAAGRGALKGLGSDIGSGTGALLGAGLGIIGGPVGMGIGGLAGGLGGSYLGTKTMGEVLGPYDNETDDERLERMLAAREKKTNSTETDTENKKAAQALLNNTTLTLAEKMAAYKNLLTKQALGESTMGAGPFPPTGLPGASAAGFNPASAQIPTSPTTGRPMTSPDAPTVPGVSLTVPSSAPTSTDSPSLRAAVANLTGKPMDVDAAGAALSQKFREDQAKRMAAAAAAKASDRESALNTKVYKEKFLGNLKSVGDATVSAGKSIGGGLLDAGGALLSAPGYLAGKGRDAIGAGIGAGKALGNWLHPSVPEPTMMDKLKPYAPYAMLGAGGLGALALADYMSRRNTKKKPKRTSNEEYDMPKAANVNLYQLARQRQKQAMIPTPYALPMAPAAIKAMTNPSLLSRLSALAGRGRNAVSGLPTWAKITGGMGAAGGAGAGIGALGGMFAGKDPSMLEQIMKSKYTPYAAAGLGTAGLLGGAAYMGNNAGKNEAKKKKSEGEKKADLASAGMGGAMGAGLGGVAGGLYGALAPGYEEDPETGRRRRRSRLMAALRGLAGGAAAGGLAGAGIGHMFPGVPNAAMDQIGMGKELQLPPAAPAGENTRLNAAQMSPAKQKLHAFIAQRNKKTAPVTPDATEMARADAYMAGAGEEPAVNPVTGGANAGMQAATQQ